MEWPEKTWVWIKTVIGILSRLSRIESRLSDLENKAEASNSQGGNVYIEKIESIEKMEIGQRSVSVHVESKTIRHIESVTQDEYDSLPVKDDKTIYMVNSKNKKEKN